MSSKGKKGGGGGGKGKGAAAASDDDFGLLDAAIAAVAISPPSSAGAMGGAGGPSGGGAKSGDAGGDGDGPASPAAAPVSASALLPPGFVPTAKGVAPSRAPIARGVTGFTDSFVAIGQTEPPTIPVREKHISNDFRRADGKTELDRFWGLIGSPCHCL